MFDRTATDILSRGCKMREGGKNKYILRAKDYVWTGEACVAAGTIKYSAAG